MTDDRSAPEARLQVLAGTFALLFLMSGAEGQAVVQFSFLSLCAGCMLLSVQWQRCRRLWREFRHSHPQISRDLNLLFFRWYWY